MSKQISAEEAIAWDEIRKQIVIARNALDTAQLMAMGLGSIPAFEAIGNAIEQNGLCNQYATGLAAQYFAKQQGMTQERAREIYEQCQTQSQSGPWSDQLRKVMTPQEIQYVNSIWVTMPGSTSYSDAFLRIRNNG